MSSLPALCFCGGAVSVHINPVSSSLLTNSMCVLFLLFWKAFLMMAGQDKKPGTQTSLYGAGQRLTIPFPDRFLGCKCIKMGKGNQVDNGI